MGDMMRLRLRLRCAPCLCILYCIIFSDARPFLPLSKIRLLETRMCTAGSGDASIYQKLLRDLQQHEQLSGSKVGHSAKVAIRNIFECARRRKAELSFHSLSAIGYLLHHAAPRPMAEDMLWMAWDARQKNLDSHIAFHLGSWRKKKRDYFAAAKYFLRSATLNSHNTMSWRLAMQLFYEAKQHKGAIDAFNQAVSHGVKDHFIFALARYILFKQGQQAAVKAVLDKGFQMGALLHRDQYPKDLLRGSHLRNMPWWDPTLFRAAQMLEASFKEIKQEFEEFLARWGSQVLNTEPSDLAQQGEWKQLMLYITGTKQERSCEEMPILPRLLLNFLNLPAWFGDKCTSLSCHLGHTSDRMWGLAMVVFGYTSA